MSSAPKNSRQNDYEQTTWRYARQSEYSNAPRPEMQESPVRSIRPADVPKRPPRGAWSISGLAAIMVSSGSRAAGVRAAGTRL
jgi:hypothetical protein